MPPLLHVDAPIRNIDISGVERMDQQVLDPREMDKPCLTLRKQRVVV